MGVQDCHGCSMVLCASTVRGPPRSWRVDAQASKLGADMLGFQLHQRHHLRSLCSLDQHP